MRKRHMRTVRAWVNILMAFALWVIVLVEMGLLVGYFCVSHGEGDIYSHQLGGGEESMAGPDDAAVKAYIQDLQSGQEPGRVDPGTTEAKMQEE